MVADREMVETVRRTVHSCLTVEAKQAPIKLEVTSDVFRPRFAAFLRKSSWIVLMDVPCNVVGIRQNSDRSNCR